MVLNRVPLRVPPRVVLRRNKQTGGGGMLVGGTRSLFTRARAVHSLLLTLVSLSDLSTQDQGAAAIPRHFSSLLSRFTPVSLYKAEGHHLAILPAGRRARVVAVARALPARRRGSAFPTSLSNCKLSDYKREAQWREGEEGTERRRE